MTTETDTLTTAADDLAAAVEAKREEIHEIQRRIIELEHTPNSAAEAEQWVADYLDAKAEEFKESRVIGAFTYRRGHDQGARRPGPLFNPGEAEAFFAFAFRKEIQRALMTEIKKRIPEDTPHSDEIRREIETLDGQRLGHEIEEENLIQKAAKAGITIPRRPEADPRALLEAVEPGEPAEGDEATEEDK